MAEPSYFNYQGPGKPPGYTPPEKSGWDWKSVLSGLSAQSATPVQQANPMMPVFIVAIVCVAALTLYLASQ